MKKILSLVLVIVMMMSMTVTAFAAEGEQSGTSTVTAVVPEAVPEYTIHIPADVTLEYGNGERQLVGEVSVTDVKNLAEDGSDGIVVYMDATALESTAGDVIPAVFEYIFDDDNSYSDITKKGPYVYNGLYSPAYLYATVTAADWEAAKPGTYTATITYSFQLRHF